MSDAELDCLEERAKCGQWANPAQVLELLADRDRALREKHAAIAEANNLKVALERSRNLSHNAQAGREEAKDKIERLCEGLQDIRSRLEKVRMDTIARDFIFDILSVVRITLDDSGSEH